MDAEHGCLPSEIALLYLTGVGDKDFVMKTKAKLGAKALGRREMKTIEGYDLRDSQNPYNRVFDPEKCSLSLKNDHLWHVS